MIKRLENLYRSGVYLRTEGKATVAQKADTGEEFRVTAQSGEDALKAITAWLKGK